MKENTIFITAFITNINSRQNRNINNYIDYGKKMLNLNISQITFIEKHIFYEFFTEYNNEKNKKMFSYFVNDKLNTFEYITHNQKIFVFFNKEDNYLYHYMDSITDFNIITDNSLKDTIEYMFVQCHKTEWVKMAIYLMKQEQEQLQQEIKEDNHFLWIDYGIFHMIRNEEVFQKEIEQLEHRNSLQLHSSVRIASCWNINYNYNINIYKQIAWYFAGSIFGGNVNELLVFADKMKEKCLQIIQEKSTLMWEVNIWYLIYLECPTLFDSYLCDHNSSIIINY